MAKEASCATSPPTPAARLVSEYLEVAGHGSDLDGPLFRPIRNQRAGHTATALTPGGVYSSRVVVRYMKQLGITGENMGPHALRATAATCALEHSADIAKVQEWLGHANISTTRVYDRQGSKPRTHDVSGGVLRSGNK